MSSTSLTRPNRGRPGENPDLRQRTEAKARTNQDHKCPFCGDERRPKWGRTRTKVQRYRCCGCQKTYSGRTGSAIGRIHRPDLFMDVVRDIWGSDAPQSVRKLAEQLDLNKYTVWRWRMLVLNHWIERRGDDPVGDY